MVDIVGRLPTQGGRPAIDVRISTEFREWLLAMWRRTGGDGDMVDDVTSTAVTAAALVATLSGQVAALEARIASLEAAAARPIRPPLAVGDSVVYAPRLG